MNQRKSAAWSLAHSRKVCAGAPMSVLPQTSSARVPSHRSHTRGQELLERDSILRKVWRDLDEAAPGMRDTVGDDQFQLLGQIASQCIHI